MKLGPALVIFICCAVGEGTSYANAKDESSNQGNSGFCKSFENRIEDNVKQLEGLLKDEVKINRDPYELSINSSSLEKDLAGVVSKFQADVEEGKVDKEILEPFPLPNSDISVGVQLLPLRASDLKDFERQVRANCDLSPERKKIYLGIVKKFGNEELKTGSDGDIGDKNINCLWPYRYYHKGVCQNRGGDQTEYVVNELQKATKQFDENKTRSQVILDLAPKRTPSELSRRMNETVRRQVLSSARAQGWVCEDSATICTKGARQAAVIVRTRFSSNPYCDFNIPKIGVKNSYVEKQEKIKMIDGELGFRVVHGPNHVDLRDISITWKGAEGLMGSWEIGGPRIDSDNVRTDSTKAILWAKYAEKYPDLASCHPPFIHSQSPTPMGPEQKSETYK